MNAQLTKLTIKVADFLQNIGWKDTADAQWDNLQNSLPQLKELFFEAIPKSTTSLMAPEEYKAAATAISDFQWILAAAMSSASIEQTKKNLARMSQLATLQHKLEAEGLRLITTNQKGTPPDVTPEVP